MSGIGSFPKRNQKVLQAGKRINLDRDYLIDKIYECRGRITHVAKKVGCSHRALREFIECDHPDIFQVIEDALEAAWAERIDDSEVTVEKIADMVEESPQSALAAAKLVLKTKRAKKRGWDQEETVVLDDASASTLAERVAEKIQASSVEARVLARKKGDISVSSE